MKMNSNTGTVKDSAVHRSPAAIQSIVGKVLIAKKRLPEVSQFERRLENTPGHFGALRL